MRLFYLILLITYSNIYSQESHKCPFNYLNHKPEDKCGYIEVPKNWDVNNGEKTKIAYLVITAKTDKLKSDALIFLQGGPGGNVLKNVNLYSRLSLDTSRDFILFDQRGVGFSEELCPGLNEKLISCLALDLNTKKEIKAFKEEAISCLNLYNKDNRSFSTTTNAKDIEALRKHLGYTKLNLFGGSYGTRLGVKYMELFPEKVNSAILSGVFPPEVRMYKNILLNFDKALNKVFTSCTKDLDCNNKYPNLKKRFLEVYDTLSKKPLQIEVSDKPFILNQQDVLLFMHQMLYNPVTTGYIPSFIKSLEAKDTKQLSVMISSLIPRLTQINLGVYYAIMASDEGKYNNKKMLKKDGENLWLSKSGISVFSADPEMLKLFVKNTNFIKQPKTPVNIEIPTLLISGDFDPITPPNYANILAKRLKNSQHITLKNNGHVPVNRCFFMLAKEFLDAPISTINNKCYMSKTDIRWQ